MSRRQDFPVLWKQVPHGTSYIPSMTVLFAVAAIALGVGVFLALPEHPETTSQAASAATPVPETTTAADESLCDKQAWPYIDQRCAQRVEAARGTRQVRVVTDKGNSVTVRTPEPIVEPKPKPAPQSPVVATAERPIGPPAAPVADAPPKVEKVVAAPEQQVAPASQNPAPQTATTPTVQAAVAPANPPATSNSEARATSDPSANIRIAPVTPAAASTAPVTAGYDAFADSPKKSKSAEKAERRAAEKAARREAKRQRALEQDNGNAPEEVAATVKTLPGDGQASRRTRNAAPDRSRSTVPDEVLAEVERATAGEQRGRRTREEVTVGSSRGGSGTRVYLVPSDQVGSW